MRMSCVVVGAGAAGLAVSRTLATAGIDHVVLERRGVADTWQHQRWDSFRLNTPGWMNTTLGSVEPTSFLHRDEVVRLLVDQAAGLPVHEDSPVVALDQHGADFVVRTPEEEIRARTVVIASGLRNAPKMPVMSAQVASRVFQIHTSDYRNAAQLPAGAVLVVGSAQSGCQIAEDLALAGRRVYLATSRVGRYPWIYRGRELIGWLASAGYWDQRPADLSRAADTREPFPVVASGGRNLDLRILSRLGVTLLGRLETVHGEGATLGGSLPDNIRYADQVAARLEGVADAYIARSSIEAPAEEADLDDRPLDLEETEHLDLAAADISSIVWATGFTGDLSWLHLPVTDGEGGVRHAGCASPVPGLWYVGFPWLTRRRSGIFFGLPGDAEDAVRGVQKAL